MKRAICLLLLALTASCVKPPPPVNQTAAVPDLTNRGVLVLPVQPGPVPAAVTTPAGDVRLDGVTEIDAELAYWLNERAKNVRWVTPEAIDKLLARTPGLDIKPRALDVASFRRARVQRIGDPLFGDLKRLAVVLDARYALVPIAAEFKPANNRLESAFALIDTTFGDVVWFGVLSGDTPAELAQRVANLFAPRKNPGQ